MAYNFPDNPSNGATTTVNGVVYTYNSTKGAWKTTATSGGGGGGGASVTTSNTAPTSPTDGDLWWNSTEAVLYIYYEDPDSSQWVQASTPGVAGASGLNVTTSDTAPTNPSAGDFWWDSDANALFIYYVDADSSQWIQAATPGNDGADGADGSSVTSYANTSVFPSSNNSVGDFAFATNTKALYMWDGSEWDRISAGVDESPIILTEPASSVVLNSNGAPSTVTMLATDPEGFDVTYGIAYNNAGSNLPAQLSSATTVNSNGVYTFTPSSNTSHSGSFKARLSASDGVKNTTRTVDFSLTFTAFVEYLVVAGGGGGGTGTAGGGGGAGGLIANSATLNPGTYNVTVGTGGTTSTNGTGSSFNGDSTIGGGHGADFTVFDQSNSAGNGGSGGGGLGYYGGITNGGTGTTNQGYAGGDGAAFGSGAYKSGGGGGAGGVGQSAAAASAGDGGVGYQWLDGNFYAAGGGGAAYDETNGSVGLGDGGSNIGGNGAVSGNGGTSNRSATDGAANTGSGGGGGGGAGADGVVIIRTTSIAASTTGSPTVTTDGSYNIYTFTGSGSITF